MQKQEAHMILHSLSAYPHGFRSDPLPLWLFLLDLFAISSDLRWFVLRHCLGPGFVRRRRRACSYVLAVLPRSRYYLCIRPTTASSVLGFLSALTTLDLIFTSLACTSSLVPTFDFGRSPRLRALSSPLALRR